MEISATRHENLLCSFLRLMLNKGLKGLTMDLLASELCMSKRTLYEIFGSKNQLITQTLDYLFEKINSKVAEIFETAPDTIIALTEFFRLQGQILCTFTIDFFLDMDTLYPEIKEFYIKKRDDSYSRRENLYNKGVEEGVLRSDVNFIVTSAMFEVQMEALKRMEDRFANRFTLEEIFNSITIGFLRSIATEKGLDILDKHLENKCETNYLDFIAE